MPTPSMPLCPVSSCWRGTNSAALSRRWALASSALATAPSHAGVAIASPTPTASSCTSAISTAGRSGRRATSRRGACPTGTKPGSALASSRSSGRISGSKRKCRCAWRRTRRWNSGASSSRITRSARAGSRSRATPNSSSTTATRTRRIRRSRSCSFRPRRWRGRLRCSPVAARAVRTSGRSGQPISPTPPRRGRRTASAFSAGAGRAPPPPRSTPAPRSRARRAPCSILSSASAASSRFRRANRLSWFSVSPEARRGRRWQRSPTGSPTRSPSGTPSSRRSLGRRRRARLSECPPRRRTGSMRGPARCSTAGRPTEIGARWTRTSRSARSANSGCPRTIRSWSSASKTRRTSTRCRRC